MFRSRSQRSGVRAGLGQSAPDDAVQDAPQVDDARPPYGSPPPSRAASGVTSRRWFWPAVAGSCAFLVGLGAGSAQETVTSDQVTGSPLYLAVVAERDDARAAERKAVADAQAARADVKAAASDAAEADRLLSEREAALDARESAIAARESQVVSREEAVALAEQQVESAQPTQAPQPPVDVGATLDPRFGTCKEAKAHGYGPYFAGVDPEYDWYRDADKDGIVCE